MDADSLDYQRYSEALQNKRCPFAFIDLDRFTKNAQALRLRANGIKIRIASKSIRSVSLIHEVLKMDGFQGVLAYSGWEAVHLFQSGIKDIVIAYPVVSQSEISAVLDANQKGAEIVLMVDRIEHLEVISKVGSAQSTQRIPIAIDIDVSNRWAAFHFGVRRSSIYDSKSMTSFLSSLKNFPLLQLVGVMGYEAQIAGVADRDPLVRFLKKKALPSISKLRQELVECIRKQGYHLQFVNGGGTGSLESTREDQSVTEVTAGSGLFSPTLFDHYDHFHHEPSAFFALQVTRKPESKIVTCFSGGYIASGSISKEKLPTPVYPTGLTLLPHEGAGEVQTPVMGDAAQKIKIGDLVFFRHAKAGEFCERFNELHLVSGNKILKTVLTYRGEGLNFG